MKRLILLSGFLVFGSSSVVLAQVAPATTVQQPTFNFTTVGTTVTAPDGGTMSLGGVSRASSGRNSSGVPILGKLPFAGRAFGNRSIGNDVSAGGMSVTPRIIILEEEEAKLGLPTDSSGAPIGVAGAHRDGGIPYRLPARELSEADLRAAQLSQHISRSMDLPAEEVQAQVGPSPEEIRRRNELAAEARDAEAVKFFEKAKEAEVAGKMNVAKIYYNMAARRATGEFKSEVQAKLNALSQ